MYPLEGPLPPPISFSVPDLKPPDPPPPLPPPNPTAMPSTAAATMARPSPRPSSSCSASKPRKSSPSPSPSPTTAPKHKTVGSTSTSSRRRSPLSDLNSRDSSAARERPGCFRFLLPSTTAASGSRSRARSASTPRTPRRPDSKPRHGTRGPDRLPDKESRTRETRCAGQEPRMGGQEPIRARINKIVPAVVKKQWPPKDEQLDQFQALTPEKKADSEATLSTGVTPPVHASISPEVAAACGSATPACFAAGHHVVPGVGDRRKCRPRGILAIAGEGFTSEDLDEEPSRASIQWLSSPSGAGAWTSSTKCGTEEASVNWLASPRDRAGVDLFEDEIFVPRCSSEDAFWRFSPDCTGLLGSPLLGGLLDFGTPASDLSGATPSSGFLPTQKTPSSGDSVSPFSLIVKRAPQSSSRFRTLCAHQGRLGSSYRYGSAAAPTPISGESCSDSVSNGTRSGFTRTGNRPLKTMDPVLECLEMMSLSPRPGDDDYDGNGLSFQFAGAPTPLESIDLTSFKRSPRHIEFKAKETSFRKPTMADTRISWREGLVSRIFDMGDLDCCKWLSDDEDSPLLSHTEEALADGTNSQPTNGSCLHEGGDQQEACGFGSVEFTCIGDELNNDSIKASPNHVSVAESMNAEGFELVTSDDSDWTLFYKNYLFES